MGARTIVSTMKNEGPFILEWVAYHRLIGFDQLVVFANDCTDGSDRLLAALDAAGLIRFHENSDTPDGLPADPQNRAYRRAFAMPEVRGSDWLIALDGDEFFTIHAGKGRLDDLFAALSPRPDAIGATWCIFGTGGVMRFEDAPQIAQFTRAAPKDLPVTFKHYGLKTLFRPEPVHRMGVHRPFFRGEFSRPGSALRWVNGSGRDVTDHYRTRGWSSTVPTVGYDLCQVNHYMIRSAEVFLMKKWRGTANSSNTDRINFDYFEQFNANHESEHSMRRWIGPVSEEIARIKAEHPEIARLHDTCVAYFRSQIDSLRAELDVTAPEIAARLFDPEETARDIHAQETWLGRKRDILAAQRSATEDGGDEDAEDIAAPSEAAPELAPEAKVEAAPAWLADLRRSGFRKGFYACDKGYAAIHVDRGTDRLVVSFDNLSSVRDPALDRGPWGYEFVRKGGWSQLGILSFEPNWFRDPALFAYLEGLRDSGFFARFREVAFMGTSMGGYGACAFASLSPGATVIAFSPQSTLDDRLVPWESRFGSGRKADWTGPYGDGAAEVATAGQVYLFYDPAIEGDRRHADRFATPNVRHMRTRHAGHKSALFLRRAEILSRVVTEAVTGQLTEARFYELYRNGRRLPWFMNALTDRSAERGRTDLVRRAVRHLEGRGQTALAGSIARRHAL